MLRVLVLVAAGVVYSAIVQWLNSRPSEFRARSLVAVIAGTVLIGLGATWLAGWQAAQWTWASILAFGVPMAAGCAARYALEARD